jgi:hypothetical protein
MFELCESIHENKNDLKFEKKHTKNLSKMTSKEIFNR